jgi:hypothetical protein
MEAMTFLNIVVLAIVADFVLSSCWNGALSAVARRSPQSASLNHA